MENEPIENKEKIKAEKSLSLVKSGIKWVFKKFFIKKVPNSVYKILKQLKI